MTTGDNVTYLVADIIGSSLLMQQDQRIGIGLFETFQSILVPIINQEGGTAIEFTGDAVSACFSCSQSAAAAGFAIQNALEGWSISTPEYCLNARIGIYCAHNNDEHSHQFALAAATCLQSLGKKDALCVSATIVDEISPDFPVFSSFRGKYDLGFLPEPAPVFYLYQNSPGFLKRQKLRFDSINLEYFSQLKGVAILPMATIPLIILLAVLLFQTMKSSSYIDAITIEISEVVDFTEGGFDQQISKLSRQLVEKITSMEGAAVFGKEQGSAQEPNDLSASSIRLLSSFQHSLGRVRLGWAVLQQGGKLQIAGGAVTGRLENLPGLERQFLRDIVSEINRANFVH